MKNDGEPDEVWAVARGTQELLKAFLAERSSLTRFFRRSTGSAAAAEDLSQEAWLRLASSDGVAVAHAPAYLWRICENLAADAARAHARRRLTASEVDDILAVPDPNPDPEAALIARDTLLRLLAAMDRLPPRRRAILLAARLDRVPHRDLAAIYKVSTRTIEVEIRKAIDDLARVLTEG